MQWEGERPSVLLLASDQLSDARISSSGKTADWLFRSLTASVPMGDNHAAAAAAAEVKNWALVLHCR